MPSRSKKLERVVADNAVSALSTWLPGYTDTIDNEETLKIVLLSQERDITEPREIHTGRAIDVSIGEGYAQNRARQYTVEVWVRPMDEED